MSDIPAVAVLCPQCHIHFVTQDAPDGICAYCFSKNPLPQAQGAVMSETLRTDNAEYINIRFARELERDLMRAMKERDEWKAKAEANERDAERYRYLKTLDDWFEFQGFLESPTVGDIDKYIDAARSAKKEK